MEDGLLVARVVGDCKVCLLSIVGSSNHVPDNRAAHDSAVEQLVFVSLSNTLVSNHLYVGRSRVGVVLASMRN